MFLRSARLVLPLSDEEYVSRIRRGVRLYERWRWWLAAFYGAGFVGFCVLCVFAGHLVAGLGQLVNAQQPALAGLAIGAMIGLLVGGVGFKIVHGVGFAFSSLRTERLLLRYHDALADLARNEAGLLSENGDRDSLR